MGSKNQNAIINVNHKKELSKNETGDIFLKKNKAADTMANIFIRIIIIFISLRVIK